MPTQQQSSRFGRTSSTSTSQGRGRFARGTSTPRSSTQRSRPSTTGLRRRKPQQSGLKKVMSSVLPAAAAKKATPSSKKGKAGGAALFAAAAGVAFSQRDKLTSRFNKEEKTEPTGAAPTSNSTVPPTTPIT